VKNPVSRFTNSQFANDESGATAIEYGLIASLIALAIIVAVTAVSTELGLIFGRISTALAP
jgi:pilus assembly protein Flp/PilA